MFDFIIKWLPIVISVIALVVSILVFHQSKQMRTSSLFCELVALRYDASLEKFRSDCQRITAFYLIERYPLSTEPGATETDVHESIERARALVEQLRKAVS